MAHNREKSGPVAVALSGGVDSAAALLRLLPRGEQVFGVCGNLHGSPGEEDAADRAGDLCARLGIEFHRVDLRDAFQRLVIEPFIAEYAAGRTPNPCVGCNVRVKFGALARAALDLGACCLATGHYAQLEWSGDGGPYLMMAADRHKDQSYVLHRLSREQLARAAFPNGAFTRAENEALVAREVPGVSPASPSQDACFLSGTDCARWLETVAPGRTRPGLIVDASGAVVGEHSGLWSYTVGQRKGLGIGGPGGRRFVLHLDAAANRVVVGEERDLWVNWCELRDVNIIAESCANRLECRVMTRYNGRLIPARVVLHSSAARVEFLEPGRAPTPGQSAVFYDGERCLGGGIIESSELTARFGGAGGDGSEAQE